MTIEEYRKKYNLTHAQMAKKLSISLSYYYAIKNGRRSASKNLITYIRKNIKEIDYNIFLN